VHVAGAKAAAVEVAREAAAIGATDNPRETVNEYAKRWLASVKGV
jgi:hypothetical protein